MSVIIKDLDIPNTCKECLFLERFSDAMYFTLQYRCKITGFVLDKDNSGNQRDKDCPLIWR